MFPRYRGTVVRDRWPEPSVIQNLNVDQSRPTFWLDRFGKSQRWTFLFLLGIASTLGCNSETANRLPVFPVEGTVLQGSRPVVNALVTLHPQGEGAQAMAARGWTDDSGRFRLTTYEANDGAAEGSYVVTVTAYSTIDDGGAKVPGPNTLPQKFATPQSSGIIVNVSSSPTTLEPIRLP